MKRLPEPSQPELKALHARMRAAWDLYDALTLRQTAAPESSTQKLHAELVAIQQALGRGPDPLAPLAIHDLDLLSEFCARVQQQLDACAYIPTHRKWAPIVVVLIAMVLIITGRMDRDGNQAARNEARRNLLRAAQHYLLGRWNEGLAVTYFRGSNFETQACRRTELDMQKDYGDKPPPRVPGNNFSSRWEGFLLVPEEGDYAFFSQNIGGLRIYIDGACIVDNANGRHWLTSGMHANLHLSQGAHAFRVEHFSQQAEAALRIRWTGGPIPPNTVIAVPYLLQHPP